MWVRSQWEADRRCTDALRHWRSDAQAMSSHRQSSQIDFGSNFFVSDSYRFSRLLNFKSDERIIRLDFNLELISGPNCSYGSERATHRWVIGNQWSFAVLFERTINWLILNIERIKWRKIGLKIYLALNCISKFRSVFMLSPEVDHRFHRCHQFTDESNFIFDSSKHFFAKAIDSYRIAIIIAMGNESHLETVD